MKKLIWMLLVLALVACSSYPKQSDGAMWDSGKWDQVMWQ